MRPIRAIVLFVAAASLAFVPARLPAANPSPDDWVRTVDGWERPSQWRTAAPASARELHPLVVAGFELFVSLGALIALDRNDKRPRNRP